MLPRTDWSCRSLNSLPARRVCQPAQYPRVLHTQLPAALALMLIALLLARNAPRSSDASEDCWYLLQPEALASLKGKLACFGYPRVLYSQLPMPATVALMLMALLMSQVAPTISHAAEHCYEFSQPGALDSLPSVA